MTFTDRRALLAGLLAVGGLQASGCTDRFAPPAHAPRLDRDRLASGFTALAARAHPAAFGMAMATLETQETWVSDVQMRFPLQSVVDAPLAAAALAQVDAGRLTLNETVTIGPADLSPMPSRINTAFKGRPLAIPIADLISLAVQSGDNTAADVLMKQIGGPSAVQAWLAGHGLGDLRVDRYEREIQPESIGLPAFDPAWASPAGWARAQDSIAPAALEASIAAFLGDPRDTTTLPAAVGFMSALARGQLLARPSTAFLIRLMTDTSAGAGRLRAGLPPGAVAAHRMGISAAVLGITPAANDIGLVTLADGRRFVITVFLSGSTAAEAQRDGLIADAARLAVSALI